MSRGHLMTVLAASFELGLPLLLVAAYLFFPRIRSKAAVVLGGLTPMFLFYVLIIVGHLMNPGDKAAHYAFYAGPEMTFFAFFGCFIVAVILAFFPRPRNEIARYFFGVGGILAIAVALWWRWGRAV